MKKGQVTIFAITGIIIIFLVAMLFYLRTEAVELNLNRAKNDIILNQQDIKFLKNYFEGCLEQVAVKGIWLSGYQAGYIDPEYDTTYGDYDIVDFIMFDNHKVPYYAGSDDIPELRQIEEKISRYIVVEFLECIDLDMISKKGFELKIPYHDFSKIDFEFSRLGIRSNISINEEDIVVNFFYPITVSKGSSTTRLGNILMTIPSRLKMVHNTLDPLVSSLKDGSFCTYKGYLEGDVFDSYVNIDIESITNEEHIVRIVDKKAYFEDFVFQFAFKGAELTC